MASNNGISRRTPVIVLAAGLLAGPAVYANGPLYIFDYETGTPYRWDVTTPVPVWTDGGHFASGTVTIWVDTPETCNEEDGWNCGHEEEIYVEFTNETGVARVTDALASWSDVPTSSFQAEVAGNFADIGIGGADGDITGAEEEFVTGSDGSIVHEVVGALNNGGVHVLFDETGSVMANVFGAPPGVLGIATPEWADEETGIIVEGWAVIGGASTWYNDTDLMQMGGVITHELGHSFNLAHTQTNGHIVFFSGLDVVTPGPEACSAHWAVGGEYRLPFPQDSVPGPEHLAVMYPFVDINPASLPAPTGQYQATVNTAEDIAAISSLYPGDGFEESTGTIRGSVTYPFSTDGIIGVNVVARNIDDPWYDAITVMTGDWNDGVPGAAQGPGEFELQGLTPGAQYVVHVENIYAGGFPTPQVSLPGPSEYYNGDGESDDARKDDACDYTAIAPSAGETVSDIDIAVNGMRRTPKLVIIPAPSGSGVTENGWRVSGTVEDNYGFALSWIYRSGRESFWLLPMGGITMSDDGSVIGGRTVVNGNYLPARKILGQPMELLPHPGTNACEQGDGIVETYSNFAISPNGKTMGGLLWACDGNPNYKDYTAMAATYSDRDGWTILNDQADGLSSRVNALSNKGVAVGWAEQPSGWWEGRVWKDGEEINLKLAAPANVVELGEATAVSRKGLWVVGVNAWTDAGVQYPYRYNTHSGVLKILKIDEPCPPDDWFCFGRRPFNPYDIADDGTLVGGIGTAGSAQAMMVAAALGGKHKLEDLLKAQGVMNATDLSVVSNATKITSNGKFIVGWTAVDGALVSFKLELDLLYVCKNEESVRVAYPKGVEYQLSKGATLGMCADDLPLQYK
jgi:hypothetical protein